MSRALVRARERFEATPRALDDDDLTRIARGDRGCLGDILSGLGALALVAAVILGAMELISFSWTYAAMALWIGGFVMGTVAQSRSGKARKLALASGPLVMAVVVRADAWLRRPGKRVGRAVVVFSTDDALRFDRELLERVAKGLEAKLEREPGTAEWVSLRALLADPDSFGVHRIGPELVDVESSAALYLAAMHVHPERLVGAYLGGEDDRAAEDLDEDLDVPSRLPTVLAIVDPERAFIEQVPLRTASATAS